MNPSLYQINTKVLLSELGSTATLDDIPDSLLEQAKARRFDWIWPLGVWQTGTAGLTLSRSRQEWIEEYQRALPSVSQSDICGSPFAVCSYSAAAELGGNGALSRLRERLAARGMRLLLDFVPNHVALDHPWVTTNPDFFIHGTEDDLRQRPNDFIRMPTGIILAHGRDPYFPGWPDTLQLNFFNPALRQAMQEQLFAVAGQCDGLRCDMAMLLEPEVFSRTWTGRHQPFADTLPHFWPDAIRRVKERYPRFTFIAEVYWGYEGILQEHGFDYTYDKTLYDRLVQSFAPAVREHLSAPLTFQRRMVRFLENHDEPRIASRVSFDHACAMALLTYFAPGLRFFHRGQSEGHRVRVPVHLKRGPDEETDPQVAAFYETVLPLVQSDLGRLGDWKLLHCEQAWDSNASHQNFVSYLLTLGDQWLVLVVNLSPYRGQCRLRLPESLFSTAAVQLVDLLSHSRYDRNRNEVIEQGLYIECDGYRGHILSPDSRAL